jgi:hypothetical protein
MNLGFSTKISGKETWFVEKIFEGLVESDLISASEYNNYYGIYLEKGYSFHFGVDAKIHTIRKDEKNRWKVGNKIHFIINNRTKNRLQFAPVVQVKSIQLIEIGNIFNDRRFIKIDGVELIEKEIETLAENDGFFSVDDFWEYFSQTDFQGSLIHWTNHKY